MNKESNIYRGKRWGEEDRVILFNGNISRRGKGLVSKMGPWWVGPTMNMQKGLFSRVDGGKEEL